MPLHLTGKTAAVPIVALATFPAGERSFMCKGLEVEQLEIVGRYLDRIRRMYDGKNTIEWDDRHFHKDDVYSFFVHCNHLRDLVLQLNKIGIKKADINDFILSNKPIQLCADLANYSKHCRLEHKTWSGDSPHISGSIHRSANMHDDRGVKSKFIIIAGNDSFDALELAEQCWTLWESFINKFKEKYT